MSVSYFKKASFIVKCSNVSFIPIPIPSSCHLALTKITETVAHKKMNESNATTFTFGASNIYSPYGQNMDTGSSHPLMGLL